MLFNSFRFLCVFPLVAAVYFWIPLRWRCGFLLVASYYFYSCWRPEYLVLLILSTVLDYWLARGLAVVQGRGRKRALLAVSLASNLGVLLVSKYAARDPANQWLVPVGVSFYVFQSLGYMIDVYRDPRSVERRLLFFALYLAFFPQLVSGPIERARRLIPQFSRTPRFSIPALHFGLRLIAWGFFKKLVVADRLAPFVSEVFARVGQVPALALLLGVYFFSIQIYSDFSGYSDIARGTARILGFKLGLNFDRPYFSASFSEFWHKWHISLSTWFRDYVYIPLGGSRVKGRPRRVLNLFLVFALSGLWHGADAKFAVWGLLHAFFLSVGGVVLGLPRAVSIFVVFHCVTFAWIFFRAATLSDAGLILSRLATDLNFAPQSWAETFYLFTGDSRGFAEFVAACFFVAVFWVLEWATPRRILYSETAFIFLAFAVLVFGRYGGTRFIYFQF